MAGERCPDTMLTAVVDWVDGRVVHVGDESGQGGGLLGVEPEQQQQQVMGQPPGSSSIPWTGGEGGGDGGSDGGGGRRGGGGGGSRGAAGSDVAPPPEGTAWQRLAAGAGGVGGAAFAETNAKRNERNTGAAGSSSPSPSTQTMMRWPASPHPQGHWNPSPYYDHRLFQFDHRAHAPDERPRPAPENSLRFMVGGGGAGSSRT